MVFELGVPAASSSIFAFPLMYDWETVSMKLSILVQEFLREDDGPTAVEYAIMLSLIAVVCIVSVRRIGTSSSSTFNRVATSIQNAGGS